MLKVYIPNNNINEREYIIDVLLGEFLGLDYLVEVDNCGSDWVLELENSNKLIVEDHFFNKFKKDLDYLKEENIPTSIDFIENNFAPENNIVSIYGNTNSISPITEKQLALCVDIFASAFFMLSRWEEHVIEKKDNHGRFLENEALAIKFNFIDRPIVNEYVKVLENMLIELGLKQKIKKREYKITITHDIDSDLLYKSPINLARRVSADIIKRGDLKLAYRELKDYAKGRDPYDTFDFLMTQSENIGVKSHFFFMGKGLTKFDNNYKSDSKFILKQVEDIKKRGHNIGIHYTYNAYNNKEQLLKEKRELEQNFNCEITSGRAHYLRFNMPKTWRLLDQIGIEFDSSMGYEGYVGFRCGVCYEFSVYDILEQKRLNIKEKSLNVMEGTLIYFQAQNSNLDELLVFINKIKDKVKQYNGEFVLLWHNSCLDFTREPEFEKLYIKAIS